MRKFDQQLLRLKSVLGVTSDQEVASLLGLSKAAFSDRKKRDAFPEDKLLALVATRPDLAIDPQYVLSGMTAKDRFALEHGRMPASYQELAEWVIERARANVATSQHLPHAASCSNTATSQHLTADELELLQLFRAASLARKMEAVRVLSGGPDAPPPPPQKAPPRPRAPKGGVTVSGDGNRVAGRDYRGKD